MKNFTTKLTLAAAAFVAVAGMAWAQTPSMEAKIPFAFRAGGKVLAPGTYQVQLIDHYSGATVVAIRSREPGQQVVAMAHLSGEAKKAWVSAGKALLSFECGERRCALSQVWMGNGADSVYGLATPKLGSEETRRMAEIVMQPVKAD